MICSLAEMPAGLRGPATKDDLSGAGVNVLASDRTRLYLNVRPGNFRHLAHIARFYKHCNEFPDEVWDYACAMQLAIERMHVIRSNTGMWVPTAFNHVVLLAPTKYFVYTNPMSDCRPVSVGDRYRMALQISIVSGMHKCALDYLNGGVYDNLFEACTHALHIMYFAYPAIPNWISCPASTLVNMNRELLDSLANDSEFILPRDADFDNCDIYNQSDLWDFLSRARQFRHKPVYDIPDPCRKFMTEYAIHKLCWPNLGDVFQSRLPLEKIAPLPEFAAFFCLNQATNAGIPVIIASDETEMRVWLVPATPKTWDGMMKIYGFPERDRLFYESMDNRILLNPRSGDFALVFQEKFNAAYAGIVDLGDWIKGENTNDPDFGFHIFYTC